ncbi:MAG: 30S ribosomal protein S12 methylthiotransferase RimO [Fimbriimonadaceae bacterium]|nr:30S ribosomal protein S12 methylthiotransferase RimO [Fimbriimonadaceae bacterium]
MQPEQNVRIITLGCAKNEVDSEEIAGVLRDAGFSVDGQAKAADITIINTCGFLQKAQDESIEAIKKAVRSRGQGKVIVAGCLAQRMGEELARLAPGADAYIGVGQMGRFDQIVRTTLSSREQWFDVQPPHHRWANVETRARTGQPWSAYLKISEGCDHQCTFCTIPSFRGKHQSKPIERVVAEARNLVRTGAVEINLIAQDVTQYGFDLYREFTLPKLLKELNSIEGLRWIRLLYFYPNRLTDEVIEAIASLDKVLPYIDIPLQHVHPDTLRRMKRPWDGERYLRLFEKLRSSIADVAIRTTFIVGFPGETEAEFRALLDFTKAAQLDRVGAFHYSREAGTPSYDLPGQVPQKVKKQRFDQLMRLQQGISHEINRTFIGKTLPILIDEHRDGWSVGRSFRDAPEIDGLVFVSGQQAPGTIINPTVVDATPYDLYAHPDGSPDGQKRGLTPLRMSSPKSPQ